jgi:hypothetical protein
MKPTKTWRAWAIELPPDKSFPSGGWIGPYWFGSRDEDGPFGGYRSALFSTRRAARAAMREKAGIKGCWPRARVVGVTITMEAQ